MLVFKGVSEVATLVNVGLKGVSGVATLENVSLKGVSEVACLVNVGLKGVSLRPGDRNPRKWQLEGRR